MAVVRIDVASSFGLNWDEADVTKNTGYCLTDNCQRKAGYLAASANIRYIVVREKARPT